MRRLSTSIGIDDAHEYKSNTSQFDNESVSMSKGTTTMGPYSTLSTAKGVCCIPKRLSQMSIQTQLLVSYGTVALFSIGFVVGTSIFTSIRAGGTVVDSTSEQLEDFLGGGFAARVIADIFTKKYETLQGLTLLLQIFTQERLWGYPESLLPSSATESKVPFRNYYNESRNVYPWKAKNLLPTSLQDIQDWNVRPDDPSGSSEHVQDHRHGWYFMGKQFGFDHNVTAVSTADALMQFHCRSNCNETRQQALHMQVSDYAAPILKSLYEYHGEVKSIEIHFVKEQASVVFPPKHYNQSRRYYTSIGCDWLDLPNPQNPKKSIASRNHEESCHPAGTKVSYASFRVVEQDWCRQQVLMVEDNRMSVNGPFYDEDGLWQFLVGRPVFDQETKELIACTRVSVSIDEFVHIDYMMNSAAYDTHEGIIRWDGRGTVFNLTSWAPNPLNPTTVGITDLDFQLTTETLEGVKQFFREGFVESGITKDLSMPVGDFWLSFHPFPRVNKKAKDGEEFHPDFLFFLATAKVEGETRAETAQETVDEEVKDLVRISVLAGVATITVTFAVIYFASLFLTSPLKWINKVGEQILESAGTVGASEDEMFTEEKDSDQQGGFGLEKVAWTYRYTPTSEITDLVDEFHTMINQFSGKGTATLIRQDFVEVKNPFELFYEYRILYDENPRWQGQEQDPHDPGVMPSRTSEGFAEANLSLITQRLSEYRRHLGQNMQLGYSTATNRLETLESSMHSFEMSSWSLLRSRIFWWILFCVTLPLILGMVGISMYTATTTSRRLSTLASPAEDSYQDVRVVFEYIAAAARASYLSNIMRSSLRDLFMFNRILGWLYNEAIPLSDTYTTMMAVSENCQNFPPNGQECPFVCDCAWADPFADECDESQAHSSRRLQELFFKAPKGKDNLQHNTSSGIDAGALSFWDDIQALPGSSDGLNASGHETIYSRLRTMSATTPLLIPLYNYVQGTTLDRTLGSYMTFAADGVTAGYRGCSSGQVPNSAHNVCPTGNYGFDGHCEETTKKETDKSSSPLFVSPPSSLLSNKSSLLSDGVLPITDDRSGKLLGHTSVRFHMDDFFEVEIHHGVDGRIRVFSIVGDAAAGDVVQVSKDWGLEEFMYEDNNRPSMQEFLFPFDTCNDVFSYNQSCELLSKFSRLSRVVRKGGSSLSSFSRTGSTGGIEEFSYNFVPVMATSFRPLNSTDFSRGTLATKEPIFSLSYGRGKAAASEEFEPIATDLNKALQEGVATLIVAITSAMVCVLLVSWFVGLSISVPIARLFLLVKIINRAEFKAELPDIAGGSTELCNVRSTFEKLHMLLRAANSAFFMGNLTDAYLTLLDALQLFTKLRNDKAIGIANNNLGCVMLTMYRAMKKSHVPTYAGMSRRRIIEKGCMYFKESIVAGEDALACINREEGWSEKYLIFMQQLSNRYFNRALFLLSVRDDHHNPHEAVSQGMTDLSTCKDMDREVVDNGDQVGFKGDEDVHFALLLGRIKGILMLMELGYKDEWDIEELFGEAQTLLQTALRSSGLGQDIFSTIEPAGQMQQLESLLIQYHLMMESRGEETGHLKKAAVIGTRMLFEDDYLIGEAGLFALRALLNWTGEHAPDLMSHSKLLRNHHNISEALSMSHADGDVWGRECSSAANTGDFSMEAF